MYSFIILHYGNIDDTIKCLSYINKLDGDYHIVVVDNNTLNGEEELLIKKYTYDILKLDKNYGFAKANNKGICYAKDKYNSNYYIVINNDVFIKQKEFLDIIDKDYKEYSFDMLGPYIESTSGESVNPFPVLKTKDEINNSINKANKLIKIYNNSILYLLLNIYLKAKHFFVKPVKPVNGSKVELNVPLHGCAIVFSKKYIDKYKDAFYNETFLFHEEEFLYQRIINDKLISVYDQNLKVFHKEGSSIKKDNKGVRNSKLFREKERINSLKLLIREMK